MTFSRIVFGITRRFLLWLPDSLYIRLLYLGAMGRFPNLRNPQTFTEKLQWLKLHNRKPEHTVMVDKYAVKDYVAKIIGSEYIIPTLGVWDKFNDIDFDALPDKFVLKTTHGGGGGGVVICRDKSKIDIEATRKIIEKSLRTDISVKCREWPYKNVPRRIIAEQFLEVDDHSELSDYKFFCFNGKPLFLKVDNDRFTNHFANYYDLDWQMLPFGEVVCPPVKTHIDVPPVNFDHMIDIARKLSKGHLFLRVDLYNLHGKIYFSELTFYPASGLGSFTSTTADSEIGKLIELPI